MIDSGSCSSMVDDWYKSLNLFYSKNSVTCRQTTLVVLKPALVLCNYNVVDSWYYNIYIVMFAESQ